MKVLDDRAWFISLEGISMTDGTPTNILTEAQAPEVGFRLLKIMSYVRTYQKYSVTDSKAFIAKNIYDYTKVNIGDLFVMRDSVWRFKDNVTGKHFDSRSRNFFNNIAYLVANSKPASISSTFRGATRRLIRVICWS